MIDQLKSENEKKHKIIKEIENDYQSKSLLFNNTKGTED